MSVYIPAQIADVNSVGVGHFEETFTEELSGAVRNLTIWKNIKN
jgi:hypothetical protein